jgi:hypothetical protein
MFGNTVYRDTFNLAPGCYSLVIQDNDDDGIDFWANNDGAGMARFRQIGGGWIKVFEGDFGSSIHHEFQVDNETTYLEEDITKWSFYPNPSKNQINIKGFSIGMTDFILLDSLGKKLKKVTINTQGEFSKNIDLSYLKDGVYMIKIITNTEEIIKKIVKI